MWCVAALLGQHPMPATQAEQVCALLDLDESVAESLQRQPARGIDPALMSDPTIYRFHEALSVYGPAIKELIHEEFGDGIMSAINFNVDIARREHPDGDRVVVTLDGSSSITAGDRGRAAAHHRYGPFVPISFTVRRTGRPDAPAAG
ncbi:hypothetical protein MDUV_00030 [Mycolicibacterium duvalii]|uniref:Cyanate hydratase n=1 Tax=Mycolicibacterium duvalii TaxID=39688 RepID=A0A7I7JTP4_9MYCO|nr:hypothetical protein MDUV_00030 [Mycolicibacterium duvalii]